MSAKPFAAVHQWDRNFFAGFLAICWLGVIMGFYPASMARLAGKAAYSAPLLLHVHALSFVLWLMLLTTQIGLVRHRYTALHKKLGLASVLLIPVMVVSAVLSEFNTQRFNFDNPPNSQQFFIIPLAYMLAFAILATCAILRRSDPPTHKRLILLATTSIVSAAYSRWIGEWLTATFGDDYWGTVVNTYTGGNAIIVLAIAYDWATRGQIHWVYKIAVPMLIIGELVAVYIYHSPAWLPIARTIIGR